MESSMDTSRRRARPAQRIAIAAATLLGMTLPAALISEPATAASSKGCEGGGFTALGKGPGFTGTVAAPAGRFRVQGRYAQFDVSPADFAVYDQAFTGAPNALDQTGGRFTPIYASKVPDHRGLTLTSAITLSIDGTDLTISRTGPGLSMSLQAKDCANGGIFQMEPQRGDGTRTRIVHRLAPEGLYFHKAHFPPPPRGFFGSGWPSAPTRPPAKFCGRGTP